MKIASALLIFLSVLSVSAQRTEIEYKESQKDFNQKLGEIWKTEDIKVFAIANEYNPEKKDYLIVSITSDKDYTEKEFEELFKKTSPIVVKGIKTGGNFKLARVEYNSSISDVKHRKNVYKILDRSPIAKGCNKKLENRELNKCFSKKVAEHIQRNFNPGKFQKLGLEKKKHRTYVKFVIGADGKVKVKEVDFPNVFVQNEITKMMEGFKVKTPGYDDDKPVEVKYTFPITFFIE